MGSFGDGEGGGGGMSVPAVKDSESESGRAGSWNFIVEELLGVWSAVPLVVILNER